MIRNWFWHHGAKKLGGNMVLGAIWKIGTGASTFSKWHRCQYCKRNGCEARYNVPEVAGVTFPDSDSSPVPKFFNPGSDPAIFQSWESHSCSDSGYNHRSNRNLPMFLLEKWPHRLLLLPKLKSDSRSWSGFSQIFDSRCGSGSERKTQNPARVDCNFSKIGGLGLHRTEKIFVVGMFCPLQIRTVQQKQNLKSTHSCTTRNLKLKSRPASKSLNDCRLTLI